MSDLRPTSHLDYCEKHIKETKLGYFYAWQMHESEENNICPITEFKIYLGQASADVSGNVSTGFNGTRAAPVGSLRVKSWIDRRGSKRNTFQAWLYCALLGRSNCNYKLRNTFFKNCHFAKANNLNLKWIVWKSILCTSIRLHTHKRIFLNRKNFPWTMKLVFLFPSGTSSQTEAKNTKVVGSKQHIVSTILIQSLYFVFRYIVTGTYSSYIFKWSEFISLVSERTWEMEVFYVSCVNFLQIVPSSRSSLKCCLVFQMVNGFSN